VIPLSKLELMFEGMRATPGWNPDGPLLWGYFFTDPDQSLLRRAAAILSSEGYSFVGIHKTADGQSSFLHVERVEAHSAQTLYARNEGLEQFAAEFGLERYDGMDVGPIPS